MARAHNPACVTCNHPRSMHGSTQAHCMALGCSCPAYVYLSPEMAAQIDDVLDGHEKEERGVCACGQTIDEDGWLWHRFVEVFRAGLTHRK